jgi:hypothetical protein
VGCDRVTDGGEEERHTCLSSTSHYAVISWLVPPRKPFFKQINCKCFSESFNSLLIHVLYCPCFDPIVEIISHPMFMFVRSR